jgi:hypothetical protein
MTPGDRDVAGGANRSLSRVRMQGSGSALVGIGSPEDSAIPLS